MESTPFSCQTSNPNKHKSNKRTKSTKISFLFPNRGNRNTKRTEKHKNKMTHGKIYNKSPRGIRHKATKIQPQSFLSLEKNILSVFFFLLFFFFFFFFFFVCFVFLFHIWGMTAILFNGAEPFEPIFNIFSTQGSLM